MFLIVLETGSYSAAAKKLGLNHTTVARRIQALEQSLGVRLLERLPGGLVATSQGEAVHSHALEARAALLALERTAAGGDQELSGTLRITAPYLLCCYLLMPLFSEFKKNYPAVDLEVVAAFGHKSLTKREADVAIRVTNHPPETAVGRRMGTLEWALYGNPELTGSKPGLICLDDGLELPHWFQTRFPGHHMAARVNDYALLLPAIQNGLGLGLLPRCIGDTLEGLHCWGVIEKVDLWLLTHRDLRGSARIRSFMDYMQSAKLLPRVAPDPSAQGGGK